MMYSKCAADQVAGKCLVIGCYHSISKTMNKERVTIKTQLWAAVMLVHEIIRIILLSIQPLHTNNDTTQDTLTA